MFALSRRFSPLMQEGNDPGVMNQFMIVIKEHDYGYLPIGKIDFQPVIGLVRTTFFSISTRSKARSFLDSQDEQHKDPHQHSSATHAPYHKSETSPTAQSA